MEKGIISTNQFVWMLFIIITSLSSIQVPAMLITQAGRDAWLAAIGGWFLDASLAVVYAYMGVRFPGENFVQYSITILGKTIGRIVGIMFPLFFLLVCAILMRGYSQLLNEFFFPNTSLLTTMIPALWIAGYAARQGIEVIGRVTELLGPLFFLSIIVIGLMVSPSAELDHLKPQFDNGVYPFLIGSPFMLTFYGACIIMAMFIPVCNRPENGFLAKFIAVSLGATFVIITVVFSVAVFGYEQAANVRAPGLELSRMVAYGNYLERVEIIWMMLVVGAGIMASANFLWAFSTGLSQILGLSTHKPLIYPGAMLAVMLGSLSFNNSMEQMRFIQYTFPVFAALVEAGLEIFLFVAALVLNKRGTQCENVIANDSEAIS